MLGTEGGYSSSHIQADCKRVHLAYAAVSPLDGTCDTLVLPVVNAKAMSIFLEEISRRHPDEFILMFLDGASWHRAKELCIPDNMELKALPPYSPELNPVENICDEIREKWFANVIFKSVTGGEDRLEDALSDLENNQQMVGSITGFPWIINVSMIAT